MDKLCSPEEIEKKRLLALERRKQSQLKAQSIFSNKQTHQQSKYNDNANVVKTKHLLADNRFNPMKPKTFFNEISNVTGKCYMISNDRFALETSSFVPALIEIYKTVSSKIYDPLTRIWNFHINDYDNLMQKLIGHDLKLTRIPESVLQIFKKNLKLNDQTSEPDLSNIDDKLLDSLMLFQRDGICYGISKGGRCMLADDMGLGKTIQALGIAHYYKSSWPLLIVVPSSMRFQWSKAIYDFLPSVPAHYIHHFENSKDCVGDEKITIISYDLLVRAIDTLKKIIYGIVILDESHVLKSNKTARFEAVQQIIVHTRHVILLTGTPALSRPIELYSQIKLILPRFMRYEDYGVRYCDGHRTSFGWDFTGSSNMQELQLLLKATCMIRRVKTDVLQQLPSKIRQVIILDPDLIKASRKMREMSKQLQKKSGFEKHNALLQYYSESSFARLKAVCDYVGNLFKNGRKCLLFAHHQNILDAISELADSMNIRYIRVDGKTTPEQRENRFNKFQNREDYLAAILSITAVNAGVTLTAAQLVVFTELFWNPGILRQAEDRVHRIGQNDNVIIQYLIAQNTVDDYIWPLIQKKIHVLNAVGLDQNFLVSDIDVSIQIEKGQQDLSSFLNNSFEEPSKDNELASCSTSHDVASTSTKEFKELLDDDEEFFNSCDLDNIQLK